MRASWLENRGDSNRLSPAVPTGVHRPPPPPTACTNAIRVTTGQQCWRTVKPKRTMVVDLQATGLCLRGILNCSPISSVARRNVA